MNNFVTSEELETGLPHVLAAPRNDAPISMLLYRRQYNDRVFSDKLVLTREHGVEGDFEMTTPWLTLEDGSPDPRIQVSLLPKRVLDLCWREREKTAHPGDQIIADLNMSLENLPTGALLQVGTAVLRVSDLWNEGCVKWRARFGRAAYAWVSAPAHESLRLRGIFCQVIQDGEVTLQDRIIRL